MRWLVCYPFYLCVGTNTSDCACVSCCAVREREPMSVFYNKKEEKEEKEEEEREKRKMCRE